MRIDPGEHRPCKFGRHRWVIEEKEILPSGVEQAGDREFKTRGINPTEKFCIVTYVCYDCGAQKVEKI